MSTTSKKAKHLITEWKELNSLLKMFDMHNHFYVFIVRPTPSWDSGRYQIRYINGSPYQCYNRMRDLRRAVHRLITGYQNDKIFS